jgi:hypothetical protein
MSERCQGYAPLLSKIGDNSPKLDGLFREQASAASPLLPEYGSQFNLAIPELANEFFKRIQASRPSHQIVKLVKRPFPTLFLKERHQRLIGHFETILQRKSIRPGNSPEGGFDFP